MFTIAAKYLNSTINTITYFNLSGAMNCHCSYSCFLSANMELLPVSTLNALHKISVLVIFKLSSSRNQTKPGNFLKLRQCEQGMTNSENREKREHHVLSTSSRSALYGLINMYQQEENKT